MIASPWSLGRSLVAVSALTLVLGMTACASEPAATPSPTPTGFATEEEAFAAAEETYRAYIRATNETNLQDPESFEGVFEWLEGAAESSARENYANYYAEGVTRTGETKFDSFTPVVFERGAIQVELCIDVSEVDLVDSDGLSIVATDRPNRTAVLVEFIEAATSTRLAIASSTQAEHLQC